MSRYKTVITSRLLTRYYSSANTQEGGAVARQGACNFFNNGNTDKVVGLIGFSGLEEINWKEKTITSIELKLMHGTAGKYTSKTFYFWPSNLQGAESHSGKKGSEFISNLEPLGSITKETPRETEITFSLPSDNSTLFNNIVNYLKQGGKNTFCLYSDESITSGDYSSNFLAITSGSITIYYEDAIVYYGVNGKWQPCLVYYGVNGKWQQVIPYYGVNGKWQQLGGG